MSCSEKFYIAVTQIQDFETSLAGLLKQALIGYLLYLSLLDGISLTLQYTIGFLSENLTYACCIIRCFNG
jgi:hypothetical protein